MIRAATSSDLPVMLALGRKMHAEAPALRDFPFDDRKVVGILRRAMEEGLALVHESQGLDGHDAIDGGFVGMVVERWFSRAKMFTDLALFVEPSKRGGIVAARLLREAIAWAKVEGFQPQDVQLGVSTGVHPEQTGRLYEHVGFERIGGLYRLREF